MNATKTIRYLDAQTQAIQALIDQLDEIQVAFNAQYDEFKRRHDETLDRLTNQVVEHLHDIGPDLRTSIEEQLPTERQQLEERRQKVHEQYLPQRRQAADDLLAQGQAELAELRALNPQLDEREEELKTEKAVLEARLEELNEEIRQSSRGLGVVFNFLAITKADRERHRVLGKLEATNDALYHTRRRWEHELAEAKRFQNAYQDQWELESIAVARLQAEFDQLDDDAQREDLALRRAVRHVLDGLKQPSPVPRPELSAGLQEMVELNIQTDDYHEGLASVGGFIGLLRGISSGIDAIRQSIQGLQREQQMHDAYLSALDYQLPERVEAFHSQWPALAQQFADEEAIGAHPAEFAASIQPLLAGPLSEATIEAVFGSLGTMISQAAARWG